jgi:glycogen(starch) synthase
MVTRSHKIIMFGWELPPYNSGGLGVACFGLARALTRNGAQLTFVLPKKIPVSLDFAELIFADNGEIITSVESLFSAYASAGHKLSSALVPSELAHNLSLLEEVHRYASSIRSIIRDRSFDIIHAHDWLSFPAGLAAKRISGKPLVVHVHATEFDRTGGQGVNEDVYRIERAGMEVADRVVAVSRHTKNILVERYGVPADKISVVHNGLDAEDWEIQADPRLTLESLRQAGHHIALFVGRITIQKGPDYFIRLAERVCAYRPKTIFVFAGSGDMEEAMIREAAERGISKNVLFAGFVRGKELAGLFRSADVLVMPSVSEPFGITALEAMHQGVPAIVSKQSGVAETSPHLITADFWDIDDMTDKLIAILDHPPLFKTLSENAGRDVRKITWMEAAKKCLHIYESLIAR